MTRQVLIVGAGAIGGVLCAYLESAGQPTSLLARGENARNIGRDGIRLTTPDGRALRVRPRVVTEASGLAPQDLVILATKSFSLPAAMAAAAPAIGPDTAVMPVVNGVPWWFGSAGEPLRSVDPDGHWRQRCPTNDWSARQFTPRPSALPRPNGCTAA